MTAWVELQSVLKNHVWSKGFQGKSCYFLIGIYCFWHILQSHRDIPHVCDPRCEIKLILKKKGSEKASSAVNIEWNLNIVSLYPV